MYTKYSKYSMSMSACTDVHELIKNHNFLGHEWPSGLDVKQSRNSQTVFSANSQAAAVLG